MGLLVSVPAALSPIGHKMYLWGLTLQLSDYFVAGHEVSLRPKTPDATIHMPQTTNLVHSPKYGDGRIIARTERNGKKWITVQFSSKTTTYYETTAFKSKALTLDIMK